MNPHTGLAIYFTRDPEVVRIINGVTIVMTRSESVTVRLREMIVRGEVARGARLQEESLAAMLGVSRTPLRTALTTLAQEGILEYAANRGYTVRQLEMREIRDAYLVRTALEGMAARITAEVGLPDVHAARLRRALNSADRIVSLKTLSPFQVAALVRLNEVFHTTVLEAAGNSLLREMAERAQRIPLASLRTKPIWSDGIFESVDPRVSHYQHRAIHDAIRRRDADAAEDAMRRHIGSALDLLTEQYRLTAAAPPSIGKPARATRIRQ